DLVDDDEHRLVAVLQLAQVALVQHVVGVLLRVDDPDQQVDERQEPVDELGVAGRDRGVVGQVEQHEAAQVGLVGAGERRVAQEAPLAGGVEEAGPGGARRTPDARGGLRRRRPDDADVGARGPGEGVEQGGLAGAGPPDERDDGVVDAELEALDDPHEIGAGAVAHLAVETAARPVDGVTDLLHPSAQLGPHLTGHTYSRSSLARNRSRVAASDGSTSMSSRALRNSSASAATAAAAHSARSSRIRAAAAVPASPSSRCTAREAPSTPAAADST